jgi:hypothetical protein
MDTGYPFGTFKHFLHGTSLSETYTDSQYTQDTLDVPYSVVNITIRVQGFEPFILNFGQ